MEKGISSIRDLLSDPSFKRWVYGTATKQEASAWDHWCRESESNRKLAVEAQAEILGVEPGYLEQGGAKDEWNHLFGRLKKRQKGRLNSYKKVRPITWSYRIAAAFLVIAISGIITYGVHDNFAESEQDEIVWKEVSTDYAEQKTINLNDGSSIILSANSSIQYSDGWVQNSAIEVKLEGEAYFSIPPQKNSEDPFFKVLTEDGTVMVTGTQFVVDTDEEQTRVVLEEGSVDIIQNTANSEQGNKNIHLKPNQLVEFSRQYESVNIEQVNTDIYTSWTNHKLVLDDTPLAFLTDKLERTYGVDVKVDDSELHERRLTGTINFRSLDRVINAISEVLEIEVKKSDNTIIFKSKNKS